MLMRPYYPLDQFRKIFKLLLHGLADQLHIGFDSDTGQTSNSLQLDAMRF